MLVRRSLAALDATGLRRLVVAGGVGANRALRRRRTASGAERDARVHYPELALCTDNGAMIALAAAMRLHARRCRPSQDYAFDVRRAGPCTS